MDAGAIVSFLFHLSVGVRGISDNCGSTDSACLLPLD